MRTRLETGDSFILCTISNLNEAPSEYAEHLFLLLCVRLAASATLAGFVDEFQALTPLLAATKGSENPTRGLVSGDDIQNELLPLIATVGANLASVGVTITGNDWFELLPVVRAHTTRSDP